MKYYSLAILAMAVLLSSSCKSTFETTSNITSNQNGDYANDDLVFGSPSLGGNNNPEHHARLFFDKSKAALRVGHEGGSNWDDVNVGQQSIALGSNVKARGGQSFVAGSGSEALGSGAIAMGQLAIANSSSSVAIGQEVTATGEGAIATGLFTTANGNAAVAIGGRSANATGANTVAIGSGANATGNGAVSLGGTASGSNSVALNGTAIGNSSFANRGGRAEGRFSYASGNQTTAKSGWETVFGRRNTDYAPISVSGWNANDRLFVVGNGQDSQPPFTFSDAMVILKNGNTGFGTSTPQRTVHIRSVMRLEPGTAPPSPAEGDMYMDAADHTLKVYDGTAWRSCW